MSFIKFITFTLSLTKILQNQTYLGLLDQMLSGKTKHLTHNEPMTVRSLDIGSLFLYEIGSATFVEKVCVLGVGSTKYGKLIVIIQFFIIFMIRKEITILIDHRDIKSETK